MSEYERVKTVVTQALVEFKRKISFHAPHYNELPPEGQYLIEHRGALNILETAAYTKLLQDLSPIGLKELFVRVFNLARVYNLKTYPDMIHMLQDVLALDPDNEGDANVPSRKIVLHQNHYTHGPAPNNSRRQRSVYKEINVRAEYFTALPGEQTNIRGTDEARRPPGADNLENRVRQAGDNSGPCLAYAYFGIAQSYAASIGAERTLLTEEEINTMLGDTSIYDGAGEGAQTPAAVIGRALRVLGIDTANLDISDRRGENLRPDPRAFATVRNVEEREGGREPGHWQEGDNAGRLRWDPIDGTTSGREFIRLRNIYIDVVRIQR
jgi:hypothetical protein